METPPLRLALDPLLPTRTPAAGGSALGYGFRLRLPDGPALEDDDPLLSAFGAQIVFVVVADEEMLQHDAFEPGRRLTVLLEHGQINPVDEVGIWDGDGIRRIGSLDVEAEALASAGLAHALPLEALSLYEERDATDDRRRRLQLLVHSPALISLDTSARPVLDRPRRPVRRRLVLVVGEGSDVRWWDPAAGSGPLDACDLPLSGELTLAFEQLQDGLGSLGADASATGLEHAWARQSLQTEARRLWLRARLELGCRYVVGYLGPDMDEPIWTPTPEVEADDGIPF